MKNSKVALITGGSRGIGLGIAKALAKEGWSLAINGVRPADAIHAVVEKLKNSNTDVIYCQGDIGNDADRQKIIQAVTAHFGQLNILVNNAGIAPKERGDLLDMSLESFDRVLNVNLKGTFFLSQLAAKSMIETQRKDPNQSCAIINISSISATVVSVNRGQYCISKAGLSMVTQLFAARLGSQGIPVYEIRPGIISTDMTAVVKDKYDKLFSEDLAVQARWGQPEDVGKAVASIARGDMPYSTGQVIMVDGGLTMNRL